MNDAFDDILDLEGDFYTEGHNQGWSDGLVAGRTEGRLIGMEKGFQKFVEAGRLYGKSLVWANRLPNHVARESQGAESHDGPLPPLANNQRLRKHITAIHDLLEPDTLPTQNTDEAVEDIDSRIRKAQGKVRVVERVIGEVSEKTGTHENTGPAGGKNDNIEDARNINPAAIREHQ